MQATKKTRAKRAKRHAYPSPLNIDLACGQRKREGYLGVDVAGDADIIHDLDEIPWPFDDSSVDNVHISHYLEHIWGIIPFMNELYRIMKPGAQCVIEAPYYTSIRCWQDPTHVRAISENTFLYFNRGWRQRNRLDHYAIFADFDFRYDFLLHDEWANKPIEELKFAIRHYWNVVSDIRAYLTKRA